MRLLIAGIPGTGKTQFGDYLASAHDFVDRDLEDTNEFAKFAANPSD
jgi:adenylate kinase family enzyme